MKFRRRQPIISLSPYQRKWTIIARVIRKWNVRQVIGPRGIKRYLKLVLLDEESDIDVTMFDEVIDKMSSTLEKGKVYYISNGSIIDDADYRYRTIPCPYQMRITLNTKVEEVAIGSADIQDNLYRFANFENLQQYINATYLLDAIDVVLDVKELHPIRTKKGEQTAKRELEFYTIKAWITRINFENSLWYNACKHCYRKAVKLDNNTHACRHCNLDSVDTTLRYRVNIEVQDSQRSAWLTLFNDEASQIFGRSANELNEILHKENGDELLDIFISGIIWKQHLFIIRGRQSIYENSRIQGLTVVASKPVDFIEEMQFMLHEITLRSAAPSGMGGCIMPDTPSMERPMERPIGISRDSMHKRRATGGKKKAWRKKRKYELGRQAANTKLSSNKTVRRVRVRGGNVKWRALRLDTGNYSWGSEAVTRKTRLLDVVYNASNNELVRTQTLVKSAIVQVDVAPFKQWYLQHYGIDIGRKKKAAAKKETTECLYILVRLVIKLDFRNYLANKKFEKEADGTTTEEAKKSKHVLRKLEKRQEGHKLDPHIEEQFSSGRLLACISSRPGQCGRADGYILEGKELEFYMKKLQRKKGKGGAGAAA
ncbi:hypothetical protein HHK36_022232 [Tetracentron sinense]|uniref:40S ribosomal protein S8 n=1 Tax=Tetracentron sinense TaxID=13715 RepID=A0A835D8M4_TETSI|nr:hypothetical protein HHK36_022232 [Tetracentron sinense]